MSRLLAKSKESLRVAEKCTENGNQDYNSAVNRYYYSLLQLVLNYCVERELPYNKGRNNHEDILNAFLDYLFNDNLITERDRVNYFQIYKVVKNNRTDADYNDSIFFGKKKYVLFKKNFDNLYKFIKQKERI